MKKDLKVSKDYDAASSFSTKFKIIFFLPEH